jgi:prevent-host-death family protein
MKKASVAELKAQLGTFLKAAENGPVVVTRKGKPVAVLIGVQGEENTERLLMAHSPQLRAILEHSRQQFREGKWLSEEEFWSQFEPGQPSRGPTRQRRKRA